MSVHLVRNPNRLIERLKMYLTIADLLAVMVALALSVTLVITTARANARLTESANYWRSQYYQAKKYADLLTDAEIWSN